MPGGKGGGGLTGRFNTKLQVPLQNLSTTQTYARCMQVKAVCLVPPFEN